MIRIVTLSCIALLILTGAVSIPDKKYFNVFLEAYSADMEHLKKFKLESYNAKYQSNRVSRLTLSYRVYGDFNQEDARALIIDVVDDLLKVLNSNSYLRTHVISAPFTEEQLKITLKFQSAYAEYADPFRIETVELNRGFIQYASFSAVESFYKRHCLIEKENIKQARMLLNQPLDLNHYKQYPDPEELQKINIPPSGGNENTQDLEQKSHPIPPESIPFKESTSLPLDQQQRIDEEHKLVLPNEEVLTNPPYLPVPLAPTHIQEEEIIPPYMKPFSEPESLEKSIDQHPSIEQDDPHQEQEPVPSNSTSQQFENKPINPAPASRPTEDKSIGNPSSTNAPSNPSPGMLNDEMKHASNSLTPMDSSDRLFQMHDREEEWMKQQTYGKDVFSDSSVNPVIKLNAPSIMPVIKEPSEEGDLMKHQEKKDENASGMNPNIPTDFAPQEKSPDLQNPSPAKSNLEKKSPDIPHNISPEEKPAIPNNEPAHEAQINTSITIHDSVSCLQDLEAMHSTSLVAQEQTHERHSLQKEHYIPIITPSNSDTLLDAETKGNQILKSSSKQFLASVSTQQSSSNYPQNSKVDFYPLQTSVESDLSSTKNFSGQATAIVARKEIGHAKHDEPLHMLAQLEESFSGKELPNQNTPIPIDNNSYDLQEISKKEKYTPIVIPPNPETLLDIEMKEKQLLRTSSKQFLAEGRAKNFFTDHKATSKADFYHILPIAEADTLTKPEEVADKELNPVYQPIHTPKDAQILMQYDTRAHHLTRTSSQQWITQGEYRLTHNPSVTTNFSANEPQKMLETIAEIEESPPPHFPMQQDMNAEKTSETHNTASSENALDRSLTAQEIENQNRDAKERPEKDQKKKPPRKRKTNKRSRE